jgi:hypothetical protein
MPFVGAIITPYCVMRPYTSSDYKPHGLISMTHQDSFINSFGEVPSDLISLVTPHNGDVSSSKECLPWEIIIPLPPSRTSFCGNS